MSKVSIVVILVLLVTGRLAANRYGSQGYPCWDLLSTPCPQYSNTDADTIVCDTDTASAPHHIMVSGMANAAFFHESARCQ